MLDSWLDSWLSNLKGLYSLWHGCRGLGLQTVRTTLLIATWSFFISAFCGLYFSRRLNYCVCVRARNKVSDTHERMRTLTELWKDRRTRSDENLHSYVTKTSKNLPGNISMNNGGVLHWWTIVPSRRYYLRSAVVHGGSSSPVSGNMVGRPRPWSEFI